MAGGVGRGNTCCSAWRKFIELACIGGTDQGLIDDGNFLDATHRALEMESVLIERRCPATLGFVFQRVQPLGNVISRSGALLYVAGDCRALSTPAIAACSMTLRL